jgi:hypothetical protein
MSCVSVAGIRRDDISVSRAQKKAALPSSCSRGGAAMGPGKRHSCKRKRSAKVGRRPRAEAFDCEAPAIPVVQATLDSMRDELEGIHDTLRDLYRVDVPLPELNPERLAVIKKVARWPRQEIAASGLELD